MKRKDTLKIALTGILIAVIAVLTLIGYLPGNPTASFTLAHIPVIIGIVLLKDWRYSLVLGFAFGMSSFIRAFFPIGVLDPLFVYPYISILPRILVGGTGYLAYLLVKNIKSATVRTGIIAAITTLANTVFVMGALFLFVGTELFGILDVIGFSAGALLIAVLSFNVPIELATGIIVSILVDRALTKYTGERFNTIDA